MPSFWEDPIQSIIQWLTGLLVSWGLSESLVHFLLTFLGAVLLPLLALLFVIFLIWYERKMYGRIQDRFGPNRVGPWGIFQTFADMGKIFTKELITPAGADVVLYNLAPILAVGATLVVWAVIPLAPKIVGVGLSVGLLFVIAAGGFGELAIMLAGWGSNNKFALLGGFRAAALLLAYEVPMAISLLVPAMLAGSLNLVDIVEAQTVPYILLSPAAALIFFITQLAESARAPFDVAEAESELATGYIVEYSGLKFGFFYVAEFLHAFTGSMLFATLFLGGYRGPFANQFPLLGLVYLVVKTFIVYFFSIICRGTLPRFRIDQMLDLSWKVLTPAVLGIVFVTALADKALSGLAPTTAAIPQLVRVVVLFVVNLAFLWLVSRIVERSTRQRRQVVSKPRPLATVNGPVERKDGLSA
jgi:NADH-quinone oxidoreductase subunit H